RLSAPTTLAQGDLPQDLSALWTSAKHHRDCVGCLRRRPSARRFGPSRRPRVAMEVNPAPLLSCSSSPPNPPATTLRLPLHKFETGPSAPDCPRDGSGC